MDFMDALHSLYLNFSCFDLYYGRYAIVTHFQQDKCQRLGRFRKSVALKILLSYSTKQICFIIHVQIHDKELHSYSCYTCQWANHHIEEFKSTCGFQKQEWPHRQWKAYGFIITMQDLLSLWLQTLVLQPGSTVCREDITVKNKMI